MEGMKIAILMILVLVLIAIAAQVYLILKERNKLQADISALNNKLESLDKKNVNLRGEIEYFSHPENLEKELRSKFNYKLPGEKTLIIVP